MYPPPNGERFVVFCQLLSFMSVLMPLSPPESPATDGYRLSLKTIFPHSRTVGCGTAHETVPGNGKCPVVVNMATTPHVVPEPPHLNPENHMWLVATILNNTDPE